jgi:TNF receptor-associated protein 1
MLLDIVAKSLYSENEVFVRELISNASDAIEKFRYIANTSEPGQVVEMDRKTEIHIETNKQDMRLIIQDKGIGMTKDELIESLGTIAKSGSKAFLKELAASGKAADSNIIGQFGVGFYSVFMCANQVERPTQLDGSGVLMERAVSKSKNATRSMWERKLSSS